MNTAAHTILAQFEKFLESIPLENYRNELLSVKTVEQDLPRSLNPLPAIYGAYWTDTVKEFPSYEQFFTQWWESKLPAIDEFVRKYFWGCSWEFVRLGFKARLYRTAISVLTQFHFCYAWKAYCVSPLIASWELDLKGVDAEVVVEGVKIALQIKKETYRSEAGAGGRFARRQQEYPMVIEIPYTLTRPQEWLQRIQRVRSESRREQARLFYLCASHFQRWLENGFVVFNPEYPVATEQFIKRRIKQRTASSEFLEWHSVIADIQNQRVEEAAE